MSSVWNPVITGPKIYDATDVWDGTHPDRSIYDEYGRIRLKYHKEECDICKERGIVPPNTADYHLRIEDANCSNVMIYYGSYRCEAHKDAQRTKDLAEMETEGSKWIVACSKKWDDSEEKYVCKCTKECCFVSEEEKRKWKFI